MQKTDTWLRVVMVIFLLAVGLFLARPIHAQEVVGPGGWGLTFTDLPYHARIYVFVEAGHGTDEVLFECNGDGNWQYMFADSVLELWGNDCRRVELYSQWYFEASLETLPTTWLPLAGQARNKYQ